MLFNWSFQYLCWLYISSVCFEHKNQLVWRTSLQGNQLVLLKNHWLKIKGLVVNTIPGVVKTSEQVKEICLLINYSFTNRLICQNWDSSPTGQSSRQFTNRTGQRNLSFDKLFFHKSANLSESRQFTDRTIHWHWFWRQFTDKIEDSSPMLLKTVHRQNWTHINLPTPIAQ